MNVAIEKCTFCEKEFKKKRYLSRHLKEVHKKSTERQLSFASEKEENFQCVLCNKTFTRKASLQRHTTSIHLRKTSDIFNCSTCKYSCKHKFNLQRHIKKFHTNSGFEGLTEKNFKCSKCSADFKHKSSVRRHEKKYHNIRRQKKLMNGRKCPLCSFNTSDPYVKSMHIHFENAHNIDLKWENYSFTSLGEFYNWKNHMEKQTVSSYVLRSKSKNTINFQCHRCGIFSSTGKNRRRTKLTGTCKINSYCPGSIKMKMKNDYVSALYQSVHVGHKHELKHIRLSKEERRFLASKLVDKVPHEEILKTVRGSLLNSDLQRIHLINKKDLANIERGLNLEEDANDHEIVFEEASYEDNSNDLEEKKQKLFSELSKLEQFLKDNCTTTEQIDFMMKTIEQLIVTIEAMKSSNSFQFTALPNQPGDTNVAKQLRFFAPLKIEAKTKIVSKEDTQRISLQMEYQDGSLHSQTNQMEPGPSKEHCDHSYYKLSLTGEENVEL